VRIALALALALAGCAEVPATGADGTASGASPGPRATTTPTTTVTAENLSGNWVFGSRNEPPAGPIATCAPGQVLAISDQSGDVSGGVSVCAGPCEKVETLVGTNAKGRLILQGEFKGNLGGKPTDVGYDLTYNPTTRHLVGKREGVDFWAAPLYTPKDCENVAL
jgi:hypothetical protein